MHKDEGLDFSQVRTFNLDEYLGVGMDLTKPYELDQSYADLCTRSSLSILIS